MPIFDAGYGDAFGLTSSQMSGQNQVLTQWSGQILRLGMDQLVFSRLLSLTPPGITMGLNKGDTFRIPVFNWIESTAGTTPLVSGTTIPLLTQGTQNLSGTIAEYGRGIGFEQTLEYFTKLNNAQELLESLSNNRSRVINELTRAVVENSVHNVVVGITGTAGTVRFNLTDGTSTHTAAGTLSSSIMSSIRDHLRGARVPMFANNLYTVIGNANSLRGLKDEGLFQQYNYYNNPGQTNGLIYQILGNWNGMTFIETEEGMDQRGTVKYVYVVAPEAGAQAYAKPISLYYYPDINSDAGRLNVFKWHMLAGFAPTLRDIGTRVLKVYHA